MNTVEKIEHVLQLIKANYSYSTFEYKEIKPLIVNVEYAFTCLRYAGVVKPLSAGRYELVKDAYWTPQEIHFSALKYMERQKLDKATAAELPLNVVKAVDSGIELTSNDTLWVTEEKAIAFLKDLGYRIQKQVLEFKEV